MFYLLNREFGHPKDIEEQAADPLAGGIIQQGYQCGMLWGASLAVGAEAYRRCDTIEEATALAIQTTRYIVKSFIDRTGSPDCEEITDTDWSNKLSIAKYFITGKMIACFKLVEKFAPEAFEEARKGLDAGIPALTNPAISCASEAAKKMGATDEQSVMVAGFAGGIGLNGGGCGALAAAIWMKTLNRLKKQEKIPALSDPVNENILKVFYENSDYEMECRDIVKRDFETIDEHTEYIKEGGCKAIIDALSQL